MHPRRISDVYWLSSPNLFYFSLVLGIISGLFYSLLIPFVIYASEIDRHAEPSLIREAYTAFNSPTEFAAKCFFISCVVIIVVKSSSRLLAERIAKKAAVAQRAWLYRKINALEYRDLELIGHSRLINLLNVDVPTLTHAASLLPLIWVSAITIVGTMGYLLYLNSNVFLIVLGCLVLAILTYQIPLQFGSRHFVRAREAYDHVQTGVEGLVYGAKELKLSFGKSKEFMESDIEDHEARGLSADMKGQTIATFVETYGELISFLAVGLVVFHLPYVYAISKQDLLGIVMALLYLTGPVSVIINSLVPLQQGKVALQKIKEFYELLTVDDARSSGQALPVKSAVHMRNVCFKYNETDARFSLENISLTFRRGEITFITGGNGSGKTTISKLITLHYLPAVGEIYFDDVLVADKNINPARESISAIYTDYYLFRRLYPSFCSNAAKSWLVKLQLDGVVELNGNRFSSVELSDGQRKRLALLVMLLDERPILVFDEWAADQDPTFKKVFYEDILSELKNAGKVVIVISHDDRYFYCADQLVTMESGSISSVLDTRKVKVAAN